MQRLVAASHSRCVLHGSFIHAFLQSRTVAQIGAPVHPFVRSQNCPAAHAVGFTTWRHVPSALQVSSVHPTLSLQSAGMQDIPEPVVEDDPVEVTDEDGAPVELGVLVVVLAPPTLVAAPVPAVEEASSQAPAWTSSATSESAVMPDARSFGAAFTSRLPARRSRM